MIFPRILLVEDNPLDVKMIKRSLKLGGCPDEPQVVNDGAPAIALLSRGTAQEAVPLPDLVLLDMNLMTVDGGEVLSYIRASPALRQLSVMILSSNPKDASYKVHNQADCYFVKPSDLASFDRLGTQILDSYRETKERQAQIC